MVSAGNNWARQQQGMALVMGLIILLVMTLISISAMRSTLMQERMSGAFQGQQLALQAAEAALRQAEREVKGNPPLQASGFFDAMNTSREPPDWSDPGVSADVGQAKEYDGWDFDQVARKPQYFVERLRQPCEKVVSAQENPEEAKRIVARGFGANENSQVVLETYYCPYQ